MRVSIDFYMDKEDDGFGGSVRLDRDDVHDIYELLALYSDATRAAGFSYITSIGGETDEGEVKWSDF